MFGFLLAMVAKDLTLFSDGSRYDNCQNREQRANMADQPADSTHSDMNHTR